MRSCHARSQTEFPSSGGAARRFPRKCVGLVCQPSKRLGTNLRGRQQRATSLTVYGPGATQVRAPQAGPAGVVIFWMVRHLARVVHALVFAHTVRRGHRSSSRPTCIEQVRYGASNASSMARARCIIAAPTPGRGPLSASPRVSSKAGRRRGFVQITEATRKVSSTLAGAQARLPSGEGLTSSASIGHRCRARVVGLL
jgi:hypothetical protein